MVGAFGGRKCSADLADCDAVGFGRARGAKGKLDELSRIMGLAHLPYRHVIVCYGGAGFFDEHLASTFRCVDDEIIGSLQRREQRRRARAAMPHRNPGGD